eukprot:TRINITY_DN63023_c0_g1_i1.p1 TRINITY_DN63023_c0_g1~~TRINITY_DN63023_c0_g1_i1.p1  ORF type:complete len:288 (+),score=46.73 TRINITY_DN63023_c0_g1_i1:215-1078(+)
MKASNVLVGDSSRRITVPMPQSLGELEAHARKVVDGAARIKMYHRGETQMTSNQHTKRMVEDDNVVVQIEVDDGIPRAHPMVTTNQAYYVPHSVQETRPAQGLPRRSEPLPMTGRSCYVNDYVEHPLSPPPRRIEAAWEASAPAPTGVTGRSTYKDCYPWHDVALRAPERHQPIAPDRFKRIPFEARSSHQVDYVPLEPQRPRSAIGPAPAVVETMPFTATTTQRAEYRAPPRAWTTPRKRAPAGPRRDPLRFEGNSEYLREYVERYRQRRPMIHVEPELRAASRQR